MSDVDFNELTSYAKKFSGLTPDKERLLQAFGPEIKPLLSKVTDSFYSALGDIPKAVPFIEGRVDSLKKTHHAWIEQIFSGPYDEQYTRHMYHVGDVHVKIKLPVEFMAGAMTLINNELLTAISEVCGKNHSKCRQVNSAMTAVLGYTLMIMQESYQSSSLAAELENFLSITGMSRTLFDNLAAAYNVE